MHGFGVYTWQDGTCYKGEWEDGKMQGCAVQSTNGAIGNEGQFMSDQFVGPGLACPIDTARFAAKEAEDFAKRAQSFERPL